MVFCNTQLCHNIFFYESYGVTTRVYSEYYIFYYFYHSRDSIAIISLQKKGVNKEKPIFETVLSVESISWNSYVQKQ